MHHVSVCTLVRMMLNESGTLISTAEEHHLSVGEEIVRFYKISTIDYSQLLSLVNVCFNLHKTPQTLIWVLLGNLSIP